MDVWQGHVYNDCSAFVGASFEHSEHEPTISFGQREAYIIMKALEFQERYDSPALAIDPNTVVSRL